MGADRPSRGAAYRSRGPGLSNSAAPDRDRNTVCRVLPDVPAVDRAFDYSIPDSLAGTIRVGMLVRIPLRGRRVRGWVLEVDATPDVPVESLLPVLTAVSAGPSGAMVELCAWAAWRWAGPRVAFLRAASPPNIVAAEDTPEPAAAVFPPVAGPLVLPEARRRLVRWPPASPRAELVRSLVAAEGSTIVVAPDHREDAALVEALARDGREVYLYRSDRSPADRTATWSRIREGACIVIGGRLAVFAPVPDVESIIVLDDADEALKEERAPTWHARDVAAERARREDARLDLVTPSPTIEAVALADAQVHVTRETERAAWPRMEILDRREDPPGTGLCATALGPALQRALDDDGRAVCVLNRRGRARLLACSACREVVRCSGCGAAMTQAGVELRCPRCGAERDVACGHCGSITLRVLRPGVLRARQEIEGLVGHHRVIAVEAGSAPLPAFDVAVGTEAVFHRVESAPHRPIRIVAFLEFDQELLAPRYRAAEQARWLLVRAARLLGGRSAGGVLLVQTRVPDDVVFGGPDCTERALALELGQRRALGYPPFGGLAEVSGADNAVSVACRMLRDIEILGPSRGRALLRTPSFEMLCDRLREADLSSARELGRLRVEVDPLRV